MIKTALLAALLALTLPVAAQTAASPAKKELVAKILQAQQVAIEQLARQLVEQPAGQLARGATAALQTRVPADQREALFKELQADVRKFVDETYPLVREKALKLAPLTIGPLMEERLTEDELRQVLAIFQSAAWRKFQGLSGDMQKALGERLVADIKDQVEPRVRALDQTMARRLGITPPAAGSGSGN